MIKLEVHLCHQRRSIDVRFDGPEAEAHGLSLSNCCGPQHYYFDEEEQAHGLRNG